MKQTDRRNQSPALATLMLAGFAVATPSARAGVIYWDPASSGSFGSINTITWVSPLNVMWTTSNTGGTTRLQNYTTTFSDDCNWGGPTAALGGGTVPVGVVNAGTLSFNTISGSGTVTLSGGTITLKPTTSIKVDHPTAAMTCTISSTLAGAENSLTKLGADTLVLSGSNTYFGSTIVAAGILTLSNSNALANSPLDTASSVAGDATNGLKTTVTALTFGGLSGDQDLASVFTTTAGGFSDLSSLTLNPGDTVTTTYTGAIADGATGMSLTKGGLGTQVLAGANTYSGSTTLISATLVLDYGTQDNSKLSNTAALVLGNGTIELVGGTHPEVVGSTTLTGNAKVTRTSGAVVLALGAITGTGSIDFSADNIATTTTANNASGILPFATIGGSSLAANDGSGNIVSYTGYTNIDARGPSTVPDNVNANVRILGDGTSGNIDLAAATTTVNTLLQSNPNFAATIDTAGKTLATTGIVVGGSAESLNIGVAAGDGSLQSSAAGGTLSLTSSNPAKSLIINAAIVDNATPSGLSTAGAGTVVLAGANTHTGTTAAGAGTLMLSGSLTGSAVSVTGDAALNQTSSGVISGAVGITHDSSGTSTLAGANTYSGATAVDAGILNIRNATALGGTAAGTTVANGAVLQLQDDITVGAEPLTLQGVGIAGTGALNSVSGTNTYGGLLTLAGPTLINSDDGTLTLSDPGTITGATFALTVGGAGDTVINSIIGTTSGTLTKQGSGTLTLTGANTFTGSVSVNAGVLNIQNGTALGTSAGGIAVSDGAALQLQGGIVVGAETTTLVGTGIANTGVMRNISGDNTWGGTITISVDSRFQSDAGTLIFDVASGNAIQGAGVAGSAGNNRAMTFGGSGNITVVDTLSSGNTGAGTLTKEGSGTLTFMGANTYTGRTVVSAGLLSLEHTLALQNSALDTGASVAGDATNGLRTTVTALTLGGLTGDKNLADVFTTAAGGFASVEDLRLNTPTTTTININYTYSGSIADGAAGMTLTKINAGKQVLSGANSYTGDTLVNAGVLNIQNGAALGATAAGTSVASGAALEIQGDVSVGAETLSINGTGVSGGGALRSFAGNNSWGGQITLTGAARIQSDAGSSLTLDVGSGDAVTGEFALAFGGSGDITVADPIATGAGTLTKDGFGILTLAAPNTHSGATTLLDGLLILGSGAALQNSPLDTLASVLGDSNIGLQTTVTTLTIGGLTGDKDLASLFTTTSGGYNAVTSLTLNPDSGATLSYSGAIANGAPGMTLTKTGAGTQTLTGANTYTGATTVSAGTLALVGGSLASPVTVGAVGSLGFTLGSPATSSASVNLSNGTVGITGTVDNASSYLLMTASSITGTPTLAAPITDYELQVQNGGTKLVLAYVGGSAYDTWASTNAPTGGPNDDYDKDGVANAVEFVLGGSKNTSDTDKLPTVSISGGNMIFTFKRAQSSIDPATSLSIEVGTSLSAWPDSYAVPDTATANNPGVTVQKDTPADFDTITLSVPKGADVRKFARLKVTITP